MSSEQDEEDGAVQLNLEDSRKMKPPNKKKFDEDMDDLTNQIKGKEAELEKVKQLGLEIKALKAQRFDWLGRRKQIVNDLDKLNREIPERMKRLNEIEASLYYRNEDKINSAIQRLEWNLTAKTYKLTEEKKIVSEIDSLRRSKKSLAQYLTLRQEVSGIRERQKNMRDGRDRCTKENNRLRSREDELRRQTRSTTAIKREIDTLYDQRRQTNAHFKQQRGEFHELKEKFRRQSWKKRTEEHKRELLEVEGEALPYELELHNCVTLTAYLRRILPTLTDTSMDSLSPSSSQDDPELTEEMEDGQYKVLRKGDEVDSLENLSGTGARRSSKRNKKIRKQSLDKKLAHGSDVLNQFMSLNLMAPTCLSQVSEALEQLERKKVQYEREQQLFESTSDAGISATESAVCLFSRQASKTESCDGVGQEITSRPDDAVYAAFLQHQEEEERSSSTTATGCSRTKAADYSHRKEEELQGAVGGTEFVENDEIRLNRSWASLAVDVGSPDSLRQRYSPVNSDMNNLTTGIAGMRTHDSNALLSSSSHMRSKGHTTNKLPQTYVSKASEGELCRHSASSSQHQQRQMLGRSINAMDGSDNIMDNADDDGNGLWIKVSDKKQHRLSQSSLPTSSPSPSPVVDFQIKEDEEFPSLLDSSQSSAVSNMSFPSLGSVNTITTTNTATNFVDLSENSRSPSSSATATTPTAKGYHHSPLTKTNSVIIIPSDNTNTLLSPLTTGIKSIANNNNINNNNNNNKIKTTTNQTQPKAQTPTQPKSYASSVVSRARSFSEVMTRKPNAIAGTASHPTNRSVWNTGNKPTIRSLDFSSSSSTKPESVSSSLNQKQPHSVAGGSSTTSKQIQPPSSLSLSSSSSLFKHEQHQQHHQQFPSMLTPTTTPISPSTFSTTAATQQQQQQSSSTSSTKQARPCIHRSRTLTPTLTRTWVEVRRNNKPSTPTTTTSNDNNNNNNNNNNNKNHNHWGNKSKTAQTPTYNDSGKTKPVHHTPTPSLLSPRERSSTSPSIIGLTTTNKMAKTAKTPTGNRPQLSPSLSSSAIPSLLKSSNSNNNNNNSSSSSSNTGTMAKSQLSPRTSYPLQSKPNVNTPTQPMILLDVDTDFPPLLGTSGGLSLSNTSGGICSSSSVVLGGGGGSSSGGIISSSGVVIGGSSSSSGGGVRNTGGGISSSSSVVLGGGGSSSSGGGISSSSGAIGGGSISNHPLSTTIASPNKSKGGDSDVSHVVASARHNSSGMSNRSSSGSFNTNTTSTVFENQQQQQPYHHHQSSSSSPNPLPNYVAQKQIAENSNPQNQQHAQITGAIPTTSSSSSSNIKDTTTNMHLNLNPDHVTPPATTTTTTPLISPRQQLRNVPTLLTHIDAEAAQTSANLAKKNTSGGSGSTSITPHHPHLTQQSPHQPGGGDGGGEKINNLSSSTLSALPKGDKSSTEKWVESSMAFVGDSFTAGQLTDTDNNIPLATTRL